MYFACFMWVIVSLTQTQLLDLHRHPADRGSELFYTTSDFWTFGSSYTPCASYTAVLMWGVSLTLPVLFSVGVCFTCPMLFWTCGEFLLKNPFYFMFRVSFTHTILFYIREFLLHAPCYFMWELHTPCCVMWGVSLTHLMLFYVGSFSYPMLFYVGSFSYTRHAILCGEFLLQAPCYFMWGVSLTCPILLYVGVVVFTRPILCYVGSFSYISHSLLCGEFLRCILHLLLEEWQTNARTRSVGWSLRTTPQIKPVSWSHGYFALVLAGCSAFGGLRS